MIVEDAVNIRNKIISFGGTCENRHNFKSRLIDDLGNIYENVYEPFIKHVVFNDSKITLAINENIDAKKLIGRTLTEYPDN